MAQPVVLSKTEAAAWPVLLVLVSAVATFGFACVTPFAAFAVAAAYVLPMRWALAAIAGVWLANQVIGFAALAYPWDAATLSWGVVIGVAALAATAAASLMLDRFARRGIVPALAIALVAAFCIYEAALLPGVAVLGGAEAFTPSIVGQFALLNLAWAVGLIGALEAWRSFGPRAARFAAGRTA